MRNHKNQKHNEKLEELFLLRGYHRSCHANYPPFFGETEGARYAILSVGASSLDVTGLLALVADLLAAGGLLGAVAGVVA